MHRGFNLSLSWYDETYYDKGLSLYTSNKYKIEKALKSFATADGSLDGSKLQSNWFPLLDTDIFISHSHSDKKKAIALSGWLSENFGLKTFIDSCIWGYADDLLKIIDDDYCLNKGGQTYSYEKRNYSTSHVHMMLSTALTMMIDKAECLFFLNTPNSIKTLETINKTKSPWIYSEIAISQLIRKKKLREYRREITKAFSKGGRIDESLIVNYEVFLGHLKEIDEENLEEWRKAYSNVSLHEKYPLNIFYELNPFDIVII